MLLCKKSLAKIPLQDVSSVPYSILFSLLYLYPVEHKYPPLALTKSKPKDNAK